MFHPLLDIEEFKPGELVLFRLSSSTYLWPAANVPIKNIAKIANVFLFINCQYLWSFQEQVHSAFWVMAPQIVESCHPGWENIENVEIMENMEKMENINQMTSNTQIIMMFTMIMMLLSSWHLLKWEEHLSGNVPQPIFQLLASTNPGFGLGSLAWNCPEVLHGSLGLKIRKFFQAHLWHITMKQNPYKTISTLALILVLGWKMCGKTKRIVHQI